MPEGMFLRRDGTRISEDVVTGSHVHWVTVDFPYFSARIRHGGAKGLMRIMAEQCRSGVATISDRPIHHEIPSCLSLPVVGEKKLDRVEILLRAAEIADWHYNEIVTGQEMLDDEAVMASLQPVRRIDGA
jgi:hypothetical protein